MVDVHNPLAKLKRGEDAGTTLSDRVSKTLKLFCEDEKYGFSHIDMDTVNNEGINSMCDVWPGTRYQLLEGSHDFTVRQLSTRRKGLCPGLCLAGRLGRPTPVSILLVVGLQDFVYMFSLAVDNFVVVPVDFDFNTKQELHITHARGGEHTLELISRLRAQC
ncbi:hypothetical protein JG687_00013191 [Phytophthora cactorum]|uniref:Uncharacterized protein n=1 Tax=Phytophthora cactorum TaxID=29920 RepID=A0A8T1U2I2_9STRA|nr:hypothetical protein JG687_00013191 [Phytophthora cactorum]